VKTAYATVASPAQLSAVNVGLDAAMMAARKERARSAKASSVASGFIAHRGNARAFVWPTPLGWADP
jgi:phage-related protein